MEEPELPLSESISPTYAAPTQWPDISLRGWRATSATPGNQTFYSRASYRISCWAKAVLVTRPPSLAVFTSVAVAITLFMAVVMALISSQVSGDLSGALRAFILVVSALPIALLVAIFLAVVIPYRAYKSSSALVSLLSSYSPCVIGSLAGVWGSLWLGNLFLSEIDPLANVWRWTMVGVSPISWLVIGVLSNHLAETVDHRRDYERSMEEMVESRHRLMQVHEQTRKEVAGLLHGRVQSRLVVLGHWLKESQNHLKDGPEDALEKLKEASKLLQEITDQELRSITRQLYPSIIRTGLPSALNSLADRFRNMFAVELRIDDGIAELETPIRPKLNESLRLTVYRVTEEALSNSAKHSQADEATVSLSISPAGDVWW